MTSAAEFQARVEKADTNMTRLDGIVNGNDSATVETDNGTVPSMAKLQAGFEGDNAEAIADFGEAGTVSIAAFEDAGDAAILALNAEAIVTETAENRQAAEDAAAGALLSKTGAGTSLMAIEAAMAAGAIKEFASTADALSNGVLDYTVTNAGTGGTTGHYTVAMTGGGGSGAQARVQILSGSISKITPLQRGKNYTSTPTFPTAGLTGLTSGAVTPVWGPNTVDGDYFSIPDSSGGVAFYKNVAGAAVFQTYTPPNAARMRLPSKIKSAVRLRKPITGTICKDILGNKDIDVSTFAGAPAWDADGNLVLTGGTQAGKAPTQDHKCMIVVAKGDEGGGSGYLFSFSDGKAVALTTAGGFTAIPDLYGLHGPAMHKVSRRNDASGSACWELQGGGIIALCANSSVLATGQPIIGAANSALSGKVNNATYYWVLCADDTLTTAEMAQVRCWLDYQMFLDALQLTGKYASKKRVLVVSHSESTGVATYFTQFNASAAAGVLTVTTAPTGTGTIAPSQVLFRSGGGYYTITAQLTSTAGGGALGAEGTYRLQETTAAFALATCYTNGLSAAENTARSALMYVDSRNNANAGTTGGRPRRLSLKNGQINNLPPSILSLSPRIGYSIGLRDYLNELDDDGTEYTMLELSNGSTFMFLGGVGAAVTTQTVYSPNAAGGSSTILNSVSRNPKALETGMFFTLFVRGYHREEQQARLRDIGYDVVIFLIDPGLNDSAVGTVMVTDAAAVTALFTDTDQAIIDYFGISNPLYVISKPHRPDGDLDSYPDGTLGDGGDYPNTAVGTDRLAALTFFRTGIVNFDTAVGARCELLDDDVYPVNRAGNDTVHGRWDGLLQKGRDIGAKVRAFSNTKIIGVYS